MLCCIKTQAQSGWQTVTGPGENYYSSNFYVNIDFANENTGYLVRGRVYKTTNGGFNWSATSSTVSDYTKIKFLNSQTGYLMIYYNSSILAKTTNGGVNWTPRYFTPSSLKDMQFLDVNTGFLITEIGNNNNNDTLKSFLTKTTDGGITWNNYLIEVEYPTYAFYFLNYTHGYAWSQRSMFKTNNGGVNWSRVNGENVTGYRYLFTSENNGWGVSTDSFRTIKTTNGGVNWYKQYQLPKARDIYFLNNNTGWIGSDRIYKTTNSGVSCFPVSDTGYSLYKIMFINENTGWGYTSNNKLLITHTGGAVFISKEDEAIPENFSLFQNFPNPFNPRTKIKFSIIKNEFIKINIFNISGKQIAKLVDGKLSPGIYSVDFNGENLPSGTYFYKLEAGDFSEVKRMVLVK